MNFPEKQYIKGFNHGYLLTKYEPGLVNQLTKTLQPKTDYLDGFFSGKEEYELEQNLAQLRDLRDKGRERSRDL